MGKRILVIDDDNISRVIAVDVLKKEGHDVVPASNGEDGIECYLQSIGESSFQLIILDVIMPGISGLQVLEKIRQEEKSRGIEYGRGCSVPILMLTGTKDVWLDAFDLGCDDYLLKPFDRDQLLWKVEKSCH